jgi:hypothetical protein
MSHPLLEWHKLVEDAQSLARVTEAQHRSGEPADGTKQAQFAAMAQSLADRLERAVQDAGAGLELLGKHPLIGAQPRAIIVLRDEGDSISVDIGFDPPTDGEPAPRCYDAAISFVRWLRKRMQTPTGDWG